MHNANLSQTGLTHGVQCLAKLLVHRRFRPVYLFFGLNFPLCLLFFLLGHARLAYWHCFVLVLLCRDLVLMWASNCDLKWVGEGGFWRWISRNAVPHFWFKNFKRYFGFRARRSHKNWLLLLVKRGCLQRLVLLISTRQRLVHLFVSDRTRLRNNLVLISVSMTLMLLHIQILVCCGTDRVKVAPRILLAQTFLIWTLS